MKNRYKTAKEDKRDKSNSKESKKKKNIEQGIGRGGKVSKKNKSHCKKETYQNRFVFFAFKRKTK